MKTMKIFNTRTRSKEEFTPVQAGKVRMYVCGPTVYNLFHVGNGRTFLFFDVVRRWFEYLGYEVTYVQNITDIDDKIIDKANQEGFSTDEIAERFVNAFLEDADRLGIRRPNHQPRATQYIGPMIGLIKKLEEKNLAYETGGDVYFSVSDLPEYGKLSGKSVDDLMAGARVEENPNKRHPADFTLWKASKPGEPKWNSPWGQGRPGWHTECVVMSRKLLGETFDIHGGAVDLIFPHHENEIAQAVGETGKPLARYWMHGGFLNLSGEKMSKSRKNFFMLREVLDTWDAEVLRLFFLMKHYRSPIEYSPEMLDEAKSALDRIYDSLQYIGYLNFRNEEPRATDKAAAIRSDFEEAMNDDFNTARGVSLLFELARAIKNEDSYSLEERKSLAHLLVELGGVLGFFTRIEDRLAVGSELTEKLIDLLLAYRAESKKRKDFTMADRIRNDLGTLGIDVQDTPGGAIWKLKQ